jgi:heat shock protein HslJ
VRLLLLLGLALAGVVAAARAQTPPTDDAPAALLGDDWQWQATVYSDGRRVAPDDPGRYTLQLQAGGSASAAVDCNRATGSYSVSGPYVSIALPAVTQLACPGASLGAEFLSGLQAAQLWRRSGDTLYLEFTDQRGNMRLARPAPLASIAGHVWYWQGTTPPSGAAIQPADPARYTLELRIGGRAVVQADCNTVNGIYTVASDTLMLRLARATTPAVCRPPSLGSEYRAYLTQIGPFRIEDDALLFDLPSDQGTMRFTLAP